MIKRQPEDFRVEEVLSLEAASRIAGAEGPFAVYRLTKRGLGTDEALQRIAQKLNMPFDLFGYAGLKDKHALTVQYVSIDLRSGGSGRAREPRAPLMAFETSSWTLEPIGRSGRPISTEDIRGNRFRITVRNLTRRECELMAGARRFLSLPGARGGRHLRFVNYYGEQRFGSARHGRGFAARRLIDGDFEGALRLLIAIPDRKDARERKAAKRRIAAAWGGWSELVKELPPCPERAVVERLARTGGDFRAGFSALPHFIKQITIEAYQSWLWNEIARRLIARECPSPLIRVTARFGDLLFPKGASVSPELVEAEIPLLSTETTFREPWGTTAEEVLAEEGVALGDLRVPGLRIPYFGGVSRPLFVEALELSLGPLERDESSEGRGRFRRRVRFFLPRGSYGTVLLAAFEGAPQSILR